MCCRGHTGKASAQHVKAGGNAWDTCKPLHKWFKYLHRVLLMDDDAYKVMLVRHKCATCHCRRMFMCTARVLISWLYCCLKAYLCYSQPEHSSETEHDCQTSVRVEGCMVHTVVLVWLHWDLVSHCRSLGSGLSNNCP